MSEYDIIRNFDDMKHSVLMNAEIPAYTYRNEQKIPQWYINRFYDRLVGGKKRSLKMDYSIEPVFDVTWEVE